MTESIANKITKNSIYSIVANGWYLLSRFLLTPFILLYLNLAEYGLWMLCFVVISFLALTSIGLEGAYIKYVAEFHARDQIDRANRFLSTGLLVSTLFSILVILLVWTGMGLLLDLLRIEETLRPTATILFLGTSVIFMLDISFTCFGRALDGLQYMYLTAKVRLITSFAEIILVVLFLFAGFGIYGLMTAFIIRYILAISINTFYAFKLVPGLKLSPAYLDKSSLKLLLQYGGKMQLLGFFGIFMTTFDKIIITRFLGLAATGMYELGRKLPYTMTTIPSEISGALMPALSHLQGKEDDRQSHSLFIGASRYMAMLSAPLFTFLFLSAPYSLYVWLGNGYEHAVDVMYILSAGIFINLLTGASSSAAMGLNKLNWEIKYAALNSILCLVMTPFMAIWFGLIGAAAGVALSTTIASVYFISITNDYFRVTLQQYFRSVLHPVIVSIVTGLFFYILLPVIIPVATISRTVTGIYLVILGICYLLICSLLLLFTGGLLTREKEWFHQKIDAITKRKTVTQKTGRGT